MTGRCSTPRLLDSVTGVCGILERPLSRAMTSGSDPAAGFARVLSEISALLNQRAWGMPGAQCTRSRAWCVVNTRVSHRRSPGNHPAFPHANGFNGFLRALPGDRALLPPSPAKVAFCELDAGVEASGPHDFTVRVGTFRQIAPPASTASCPASVTIAIRPSVGQDGGSSR